MYNQNIIKYKDFNVNNVVYGNDFYIKPHIKEKGANFKSLDIKYKYSDGSTNLLIMELPLSSSPYGASTGNKNQVETLNSKEEPKYSIQIDLFGRKESLLDLLEEDPNLEKLTPEERNIANLELMLREFDTSNEKMLNSKSLIGGKTNHSYFNMVREPQNDPDSKYKNKFSAKLTYYIKKDKSSFNPGFHIYNKKSELVYGRKDLKIQDPNEDVSYEKLLKVLPPRCSVKLLVRCLGMIWANKIYYCTWEALQIIVIPPSTMDKYIMKLDLSDIDTADSNNKQIELENREKENHNEEDHDDHEEDHDDHEEDHDYEDHDDHEEDRREKKSANKNVNGDIYIEEEQ